VRFEDMKTVRIGIRKLVLKNLHKNMTSEKQTEELAKF